MEIGNFESYRMAIDKLMCLLKLDLIRSVITHLDRPFERRLALSCDDIVTVRCLIDEYPHAVATDLDDTAANRKELHLIISVVFLASHRYHPWHGHSDE